ncbi:MAG: hypothetical protein AB1798_12875, partial [Spirochaetota bacterium]
MDKTESYPGEKSRCFNSIIGKTYQADKLPQEDYLLNDRIFDSEGNWGFCRFLDDDFLAARLGFQKGGFNIFGEDRPVDRSLLQLHLELVTKEGTVLWIPTGIYDAGRVASRPDRMDIRFEDDGNEIFKLSGWPDMQWHFRS